MGGGQKVYKVLFGIVFNKQKVRDCSGFAAQISNFALANLQKVRDVLYNR